MSEFRLPALRFSALESQQLLNDQLRLQLAPALLARIQATTDGWAAGVQLIGLSLAEKSGAERVAAVQSLARERQHMFVLLAEEVLGQQDATTQQFLIYTSILPELTESLCNAVTGRTDAGELLQRLQRRNLFVLAHGTESYRYHDLFRDFLQAHLRREPRGTIETLHRRAAAAETHAASAIQHWLAAGAWDDAARRIERQGLDLYARGSDVPQSWLDALPEALIEQSAGLSFLLGMNALMRSNFAIALPALERAEAMFAAAGDIAMQGEALSHLPIAIEKGYYLPHDVLGRKVAEVLDRAFALPLPPAARVPTLLSSFWYHLPRNELSACNRDLNEVMQLTLASDDPLMARNALSGIHTTALVLAENVQLATDFVRAMYTRHGEGYGQLHVSALSVAASLKLLEGDLPVARELATRSRQLMAQTGDILYIGFNTTLVLAYICFATGDWAALDALLEPHISNPPSADQGQIALSFFLLHAYGRWMAGRLDALDADAAQLGAFMQTMPVPEIRLPAEVALALATLGRGEAMRAIQQLQPLCEAWGQVASLSTYLDPRWLLAHAFLRSRRPDAALDTMRPLLQAAERKGWPGLILREGVFVKPLLELAIKQNVYAAFAQRTLALFNVALPNVVPIPGSSESLTPREMDVLRLVASGASNQDVADKLVLSVWTVKSHLTSILGKLGAASRTQAIARARELRMI